MSSRWYLVAYNLGMLVITLESFLLVAQQVLQAGCWQFAQQGCSSMLLWPGFSILSISHAEPSMLAFRWLMMAQCLSLLEILHALLKFVKSDPVTTAVQIFSRVNLVVLAQFFPAMLRQPEFVLMVTAWSIAETVRYSWYTCKLIAGEAPKWLTWCRLTFFLVLYPLGVFGELMSLWSMVPAIKNLSFPGNRLFLLAILLVTLAYLPGLPFMYMHMLRQRKKALNPQPKAPKVETGLVFPITNLETGERSTMATNKKIFELALANSPAGLAVQAEKNWRYKYDKHVVNLVKHSMTSPEACWSTAEAGLEAAYSLLQFERDGQTRPIREAVRTLGHDYFEFSELKGEAKPRGFSLNYRGSLLAGPQIVQQVQKWGSQGVVHSSVVTKISKVISGQANLQKLLGGGQTVFVLFGGRSAMGPLTPLLQAGAIVVPLARPSKEWAKLMTSASEFAGQLWVPHVRNGKGTQLSNLGCDLLTQAPEIAQALITLMNQYPHKTFVFGNYVYLDAADFVKISLAVDAITEACVEHGQSSGIATQLAFLPSPTDAFTVSSEEVAHSQKGRAENSWGFRLMCQLLGAQPNQLSGDTPISNGISLTQGPNYVLAKRIQHWRALLAASGRGRAMKTGIPVSMVVSPATRTVSVTKNKMIGLAYGSFDLFKPLEVFEPATSQGLLYLMLIHDVLEEPLKLRVHDHPMDLFIEGACHGGVFGLTHRMETIGTTAVVATLARQYGFHALAFLAGTLWVTAQL